MDLKCTSFRGRTQRGRPEAAYILDLRQVESQFHVLGVTVDGTRYHYVVSTLDQETAGRVVLYLDNPPAVGKYVGLKELLLGIYGPSCMERAARVLNMGGLGNRKPLARMSEMLDASSTPTCSNCRVTSAGSSRGRASKIHSG